MGNFGKIALAMALAAATFALGLLVGVGASAREKTRNHDLETALSTCLDVLDAFKKRAP